MCDEYFTSNLFQHGSVNEPTEEPYLSLEEVGVALEHLRSFAGKVSV